MGKDRRKENKAAGAGGFVPVLHPTDEDPSVGTPVLGLSGEAGERLAAPVRWETVPGTVFDQPEPEELLELTVIVPARNEEDCLGACLRSLVSQSEEIFELGHDWELIVVDDPARDQGAE